MSVVIIVVVAVEFAFFFSVINSYFLLDIFNK